MSSNKIPCKYGSNCYRKNPDHFKKYSHPLTHSSNISGKKRNNNECNLNNNSPSPLKKQKTSLPTYFPNPHFYIADPHNRFEDDFNDYSRSLRSKNNWIEKIFKKEILDKWKKETDETAPWIWQRLKDELQYLAKISSRKAQISCVDGVWITDNIIPFDIHNSFSSLVKSQLESKDIDWHPYSNNIVRDLVHPSLYCYVDGISNVIDIPNHTHLKSLKEWYSFIGTGSPKKNDLLSDCFNVIEQAMKLKEKQNNSINIPDIEETTNVNFIPELLFHKYEQGDPYEGIDEHIEIKNEQRRKLSNYLANIFRWIPADISISNDGKVSILSYINGLHPFINRDIYPLIAKILEYFIPLWENVLANLSQESYSSNRLKYTPDNDYGSGVDFDELCDCYDEDNSLEILNPFNPPVFSPINLSGSKLQIIVKIASIELTPEKPEHKGTWHIEGVPADSIISTGIYYYSQENIEDNYLQFREALRDPDGAEYYQCAMGFGFGEEMNRNLGKVQTKQGRLIAFPNIAQHCITPIKLLDKTKPGHRKFLVFFLVDPTKKVLSTANVPPNRADWTCGIIRQLLTKKLPPELVEQILEYNKTTDLEQAKKYREYLMFTRSFYVLHQNEEIFQREYSYCEH